MSRFRELLTAAFSRSERRNPTKLLVTTFNNSNILLGLQFHAYKMNLDPNPNRNNPNNLSDTIILLDTLLESGAALAPR